MTEFLLSGIALEPWLKILTLTPRSPNTIKAFGAEHNRPKRFYTKSSYTPDQREETPSRGPSPVDEHALAISFLALPKDITIGYVLGSSESCDVFVGGKREGVSARHLIITFDQHEDLVMRDISRKGSHVSYDGKPQIHRDSPFTWALPAGHKVSVMLGGQVQFTIGIPSHNLHSRRYQSQVQQFRTKMISTIPAIDGLDFNTSTTMSAIATPHTTPEPVYVIDHRIGKGSFGDVLKLYNASNWKQYAGKQLLHSYADSERYFAQEVSTLKELSHAHIVQYIDLYESEGRNILVMEYCTLGSLYDETARQPLTRTETSLILQQMTSALDYIHSKGILHRDIKPANILIRTRDPLHTCLADFGLVTKGEFASSLVGTARYAAPEIYDTWQEEESDEKHTERDRSVERRSTYWEAADIWSLGVLGLEYTHGLPPNVDRDYHISLTSRITTLVNMYASDEILYIIFRMLQQDPWDRPTAKECFDLLHSAAHSVPVCEDDPLSLEIAEHNASPTVRTNVNRRGCSSHILSKGGVSVRRGIQRGPKGEQGFTESEVILLLQST